jgi:hypothetical protein
MEKHNFDGFRNPDDIYDSTTWQEMRQEVEQETLMKQLNLEFDRENLDARMTELLEGFEHNVLKILEEWQSTVNEILKNDPRISPKIEEYLKERKLDLPSFTLKLKAEGDKFLEETEMDDEISESSFLVVFNLPKPMRHYWWKGGTEIWGQIAVNVRKMAIEWGYMYRRLVPII